jgi:hypothetical protein
MFPDNKIARTFTCGEKKTSYLAKFGLAPYIKEQLIGALEKDSFVICFDESLNSSTQKKHYF